MFQNSEKTLCKIMPFYLTLQAWSSEFSISTEGDSEKHYSFECSEIVGNLPGKGSREVILSE